MNDSITPSTNIGTESSVPNDGHGNRPHLSASHSEGSDYDTDLEPDSSELAKKEPTKNELVAGIQNYIRRCNQMGVIPVEYFMRHIEDKEFVMKHRGLGPKGAQAIAIPLQKNSYVTKLNLEGNCIEATGVVHLMGMLLANKHITDVNLSENVLGSTGARYVCELLTMNSRISRLNVAGNGFSDKDGTYFAGMLEKNGTLRHLVLSNNQLGELSARHLGKALCVNDTLESLDISWNLFRTTAAGRIAESLKENCGLKHLNMSMNGLALEGSIALGSALACNRTLRELDIGRNRIPVQGAMDIAKGLHFNDTLVELQAGFNPLTAQGALCILTAVAHGDESSIRHIGFEEVFVNEAFLTLKESLESERGIVVIHGQIDNGQLKNVTPVKRNVMKKQILGRLQREPMAKLKAYMDSRGLRLIDFFRQLDKDQNFTLTSQELKQGLMGSNVQLNETEAATILRSLDKDGSGIIEFSELVATEKEYRAEKRIVMKELQAIDEDSSSEEEHADPLASASIDQLINFFKSSGANKQ